MQSSGIFFTVSIRSLVMLIKMITIVQISLADELNREAMARLPVKSGLVAFFDAIDPGLAIEVDNRADKNLLPAWQSLGLRQLPAEAISEDSAPQRIKIADGWVVRFDGDNDALRVKQTGLSLDSATIVIVAAPHNNPGNFRGLFSANAVDRRDYESGLNLDLGPNPSTTFDQLNVEGNGFGGANNLRQQAAPLGQLQVLECVIDSAGQKVSLNVDGKPEGSRELSPQKLALDEITLGARYYTHGPGKQQVQGHFQGDLAAVMIFDRVLEEQELVSLREFFQQRYVRLNEALQQTLAIHSKKGVPLVKVESPSAVQMLVPGFKVRQLPLELTNVNNLKYRRDGKLVTLGYNGDIHLLSDTDGDGLEDKAELFWKNQGSIRGPLGMVLTPAGYPKGQGVILASKGKISMIIDQDGDDIGDKELVVASGWQEIPQNVDAVGLTMDAAGNLYFGLGTANYANPYLVDEAGHAGYSLSSERGTVQRISSDWTKRETVCTGIRFPVSFGFNRLGDLFCTEQEGATWLPNGNPLDELLHIRLDRQAPNANPTGQQHFGFPPRHPRHNPTVIDEPSIYDYGPQHQSTCGMVFNDPIHGGPIFGTELWQGDAFVCGESRGKIWRTKLVKTDSGYIADSQLIACLQLLTVDVCLSPTGNLLVACHSGPPDWGTGPQGIGKLFCISVDRVVARPVAAWASSPSELQVAFDQPIDPELIRGLAARARVEFGVNVRAGDRFENLIPPYAVVRQQLMQPRFSLPVHSVAVSPDSRTITLHTDLITQPVHHAITLPLGDSEIDVDAMLNGIQASWKAKGAATPQWQGYLPHPDLNVARSLLAGSAFHEPLWSMLEEAGTLKLDTIFDYRNMLRPNTQLGAQIDYQWPQEEVSLHCATRGSSTLSVVATSPNFSARTNSKQTAKISLKTEGQFVRLAIELETVRNESPLLSVNFSTAEDATERPIPLRRFFQPWTPIENFIEQPHGIHNREATPELAGGSWGRGRQLFHDKRTQCANCHAVGGEGSKIGPDLGNLIHRDYTSVLRDILEPSRAINPDYLTHVIATSDGSVLTGVVSSAGDQLIVANAQGEVRNIARAAVEQMKSTGTSVMPTELLDKLNETERRDLLTYLLSSPPKMPEAGPLKAPPVRTRAEVSAALQGSQSMVEPIKKLHIVLIDGVKDHGPGEHDYPAWKKSWAELLAGGKQIEVSTTRDFPDEASMAIADVLVFFQKGSFSLHRSVLMDKFLKRGGGVVLIHWAVNGDDRVGEFAKRIGLASWGGRISYRHGPLSLILENRHHPILRNLDEKLELYDESYWKLTGDPAEITVLATSVEDDQPTPQIWIRDHQPGRVFVSIPGHYSWTFDDPLFRILLLRGIAWTADQPLDRFNDLVTPGARMSN